MPGFDPLDRAARRVSEAWLGRGDHAIGPLPAGGFSGSRMWVVRAGGGGASWVLKSLPMGAHDRVAWSHRLMRHLRSRGVGEVPLVAETPAGRSIAVDAEGTAWELVTFVEGATTDAPSPAQATAAAECLARIHAAAASFPEAPPCRAPCPAVRRRVEQAREMIARPWAALAHACRADGQRGGDAHPLGPAVAARLAKAVAVFDAQGGPRALHRIATFEQGPLALQAVLRDVWSAHILYDDATAARVAGVVDYHASAVDTPATDLARLVGSWRHERDDAARPWARWPELAEAYAAVRPLPAEERRLVPWLHATGVILGLDNWFRWVLAESREFLRPAQVLSRIDRLLAQLPAAASMLNEGVGNEV